MIGTDTWRELSTVSSIGTDAWRELSTVSSIIKHKTISTAVNNLI